MSRPKRKLLVAWPLKYKLAAWSSLLILLLFVGYSFLQYQLVYQHMMEGEKDALRKTAGEVAGYFEERDLPPGQGEWSDQFFRTFVRQNQMLRLIDPSGRPLIVISSDLPAQKLPAKSVTAEHVEDFHLNQDHILVLRSPVRTDSFQGTVELASNLESMDSLNEQLFTLIFVCGAAGIVICGIGGIFLSRQLLKPVQRLTLTMNRVKDQGLHERVSYTDNGDELSRLASMFNGMMDELETSFLRQRQLVEDASHEFRTPIAIIEGHLTMLRRWGKDRPEVLAESLEAAIQETERLKALAKQMLELTQTESETANRKPRIIRVSDVIQPLIRNYGLLHPTHTFKAQIDPSCHVRIDPHHLEQILIIVADNAVRYTAPESPITFRTFCEGDLSVIEIEDRGWGIPEEDIPYLFDRFYRVDKARNRRQGGSGLGLSIAKRLVEVYEGAIGIRSKEGEGTVVRVAFPRRLSGVAGSEAGRS